MRTSNYDNNLIKLQFSIENNIEKWGVLPMSACNHVYSKLSKDEAHLNHDGMRQPKFNQQNIDFVDPEEFEETELDVPGSELDDQQESVGSEDEENNYYSIGGDDHNDLEENNGN